MFTISLFFESITHMLLTITVFAEKNVWLSSTTVFG